MKKARILIAAAGVALATSFTASAMSAEPTTQATAFADLPAQLHQVVGDVQDGLQGDDDDMHW